MPHSLTERLKLAPVIPLVQADEPAIAAAAAEALLAGGLTVIEVVLRSNDAIRCLNKVVRSVPAAIVGAGTVLNSEQARAVVDAGAGFIVSPGLDEGVVTVARRAGLPVYPGIATATELQRAWNLGLDTVKFFPAGLSGGTAMLKALASVFRSVRFMPTGGVSADNLADYLAVPAVVACGGSWLTPPHDVQAGNYAAISRLAQAALSIAKTARDF